jgi:hypothetical protein
LGFRLARQEVRLTTKRLAHLVALSRLTKRMIGGSFTLHTQFAFGYGGDHLGYVAAKYNGGFISCNMGLSGGDWTNTAVYSYLANSRLVGNIGFQHKGQTVMTTGKD